MKWRYKVANILNLKAQLFIFAAKIYHLPISVVGLLDYHIMYFAFMKYNTILSDLKVNLFC